MSTTSLKSEPTAADLQKLVDASSELEAAYAEQIAEKIRAGLTREQAISCIKTQIRHDIALKQKAETAKASAKK